MSLGPDIVVGSGEMKIKYLCLQGDPILMEETNTEIIKTSRDKHIPEHAFSTGAKNWFSGSKES